MNGQFGALRAAALWREGFRCALTNLLQSLTPYQRTQVFRLMLCPVDLWRYHEFAAVLQHYRGEERVLDLGSPKVLAQYLARRHGARVMTTDIVPTLAEECRLYGRASGAGSLEAHFADATALPYADGAIPFAYSVSVIEHIPDSGDTAAACEVARVLPPGGRAVITVPVGPQADEIWQNRDPFGKQPVSPEGKVFFCRIYDKDALYSRIIVPSGLHVVGLQYWQVDRESWYQRYQQRTDRPRTVASIITKLIDPYWAARSVRGLPPEAEGVSARGVAAIALEKRT
jgi:SAM-dependent methyltransferase